MSDPEPMFQFLRATPPDLPGNPPLASSLQAFETSLELLALGRYPAAMIACVNAWESALKAAFKIPATKWENLNGLCKQADPYLEKAAGWSPDNNKDLRDKRNHMTHYGYTPRDSSTCADLLLRTGYPGLSLIYEEYFNYRLTWQQFGRSVTDFRSLDEPQMNTVGLIPDWGDLLWLALDQYRDQQPTRKIDPIWYFAPLEAQMRRSFRLTWTSQAEHQAFESFESDGGLFAEVENVKDQLRRHVDDTHVTCFCPICGEAEAIFIEFNEEAMDAGKLEAERCFCVGCHFQLPKEAGFLIQLLIDDELRNKWNALRADCGLIEE